MYQFKSDAKMFNFNVTTNKQTPKYFFSSGNDPNGCLTGNTMQTAKSDVNVGGFTEKLLFIMTNKIMLEKCNCS